MFNRSSFNHAAFNRSTYVSQHFVVSIDTATECTGVLTRLISMSVISETSTEVTANMTPGIIRQSPFNRVPFNRTIVLGTYLTAEADTATELSSVMNGTFLLSAEVDTATEFTSTMVREIPFQAVRDMDTSTEMTSTMIRIMPYTTSIDTATEIDVPMTLFHVGVFRFLGGFKPGDRLVIDTKKMTVTLNGRNVMHLMDGDFFPITLGNNKVEYTDEEGVRNILTRITHRDKFLY